MTSPILYQDAREIGISEPSILNRKQKAQDAERALMDFAQALRDQGKSYGANEIEHMIGVVRTWGNAI